MLRIHKIVELDGYDGTRDLKYGGLAIFEPGITDCSKLKRGGIISPILGKRRQIHWDDQRLWYRDLN